MLILHNLDVVGVFENVEPISAIKTSISPFQTCNLNKDHPVGFDGTIKSKNH